MLSNYCSNIANKYGIKVGGGNKLIPNLGNKSKYTVHYRIIQLYLSFRMKLTEIQKEYNNNNNKIEKNKI